MLTNPQVAHHYDEATGADTASEPVFFLLACQGWSGSNWAANALNQHPDITCTHSARNLSPESEEISDHSALAKEAPTWHQAYLNRTEIAIDDVYDDIQQRGDTVAFGCVHTFRLRDIPVQIQKFGQPRRTYRVGNLVRHPLSFIWSGFGQLEDMFAYDPFVLHGSMTLVFNTAKEEVLAIAKNHQLNLCDPRTMAFIAAAANLTNLAKDIDVLPDAAWFKMEEMTSDREGWANCVSRLTDNQVVPDTAYLDRVFGMNELNQHRKGPALTPAARWQQLEIWQRDVVAMYLRHSGIAGTYTKLGYDLAFL